MFAKRAAQDMISRVDILEHAEEDLRQIDLQQYADVKKLQEEYKELVREEIEKSKKRG